MSQPQLVKALWDYSAGDNNELSFKRGDIVKLISKCNDDWWEGELEGDVGFFPANRVAIISSVKPPEVSPRPKPASAAENSAPMPQSGGIQPQSNVRVRGPSTPQPPAPGSIHPVPSPSFSKSRPATSPAPPEGPQVNAAASILAKQAISRARGDSTTSTATNVSSPETEEDDEEDEEQSVTADGPNVGDIKKDGLLGRRNGGMLTLRSWKTLWVELANSHLYFFKDSQNKKKPEKRDKPVSAVDLKSCRVDCSGQLDKKKCVFAIMTNKDVVLLLQASSESEMQSWAAAILEVSGTKKEVLDNVSIVAAGGKKKKNSGASKPPSKKPSKIDNDDDLTEEERRERARTKLFGFFKSRPTMDSLQERGLIPQDMIFGGELALQVQKENRKVPLIVEQCVTRVEEKGLDSVGIYRLSGNASTIQKLRLLYIEDPSLVNLKDEEWNDINVITGTLKLYFRELKTPLMTFERYDAFINAAKITDFNSRLAKLKEIVNSLPRPNYDTLKYLIKHLVKVREHREIHKMDAANLAIVFGPTLLRPEVEGMDTIINMGFQNSIIEALILSSDAIF